jgi:hypothetical protein
MSILASILLKLGFEKIVELVSNGTQKWTP